MLKLDPDGVLRPYPRPASARLISYSELQSLDCWKRHHYAYTLGLKPVHRYGALQLGTVWDAFLNEWHDPRWSETVDGQGRLADHARRLPASLDAATAEIEREARRVDTLLVEKGLPRPEDWHEQLAHQASTVLGMAMHYIERWDAEDGDWATVATQLKFEVPIPAATGTRRSSRYWLHGYIDRLAWHRPTGELYIIDAKLRDGAIDSRYREGFTNDLQLALYGWALDSCGVEVAGGLIDAASTTLPTWPELTSPQPVIGPDGEPMTESVPCPDCEGIGEEITGNAPAGSACTKCEGDGKARYVKGERAGEVKTRRVMRPRLRADWENGTTYPVALAAIDAQGIDPWDYEAELLLLRDQWQALDGGGRFHWRGEREWSRFTEPQLAAAVGAIVGVAPYLDTLPPVPMPGKMKCGWCSFRSICPSSDPSDWADSYTSREQRAARHEAREAAAEALPADPFSPVGNDADARAYADSIPF